MWSEIDEGTEVELRVPASTLRDGREKFVVFTQGEHVKQELMNTDSSQIRILVAACGAITFVRS